MRRPLTHNFGTLRMTKLPLDGAFLRIHPEFQNPVIVKFIKKMTPIHIYDGWNKKIKKHHAMKIHRNQVKRKTTENMDGVEEDLRTMGVRSWEEFIKTQQMERKIRNTSRNGKLPKPDPWEASSKYGWYMRKKT